MLESALPMFSSRDSPLGLSSILSFGFVYRIKEWSDFIFFLIGSYPVFPAPFVEEMVFPTLYNLASFFID